MFLSMRRENWARETNLNPTHREPQEQKSSFKWPKPVTKTLEGGRSWSRWILEGIGETRPEWKGSFCLKVSELLHQISMAGKNRFLNKVRWQLKKQWRKAVGEEIKDINLLLGEFQSRITTRRRGRRSKEDHASLITPSNMWSFCSQRRSVTCHSGRTSEKKDTISFRWSELKETASVPDQTRVLYSLALWLMAKSFD